MTEQQKPSFSQRLHDLRTGFGRAFWVANISELFERLSYYAILASLARYLSENLHFSDKQTGILTGLFGLSWFLAPFGGTVADRLGFRRALSAAYLILSCSYFLIGTLSQPIMEFAVIVLSLPAIGMALVKPSVVGTTARDSKDNVRSIGYSIYYTIVNIGGAAGPYLASRIHHHLKDQDIFRLAALSVFLMFFAVLFFFKEPSAAAESQNPTLAEAGKNFLTVMANWRFVAFLLIFSGYWIVYWQEFVTLPLYVARYINPKADTDLMLVTGPIVVILLTVIVSLFSQKMPAFHAIILGTFLNAIAWMLLILRPTIWMAIVMLVVIALGELIQSPRYYEYISRLAPPGQQGTYMGFAFLPIGIGLLAGGSFGGTLLGHFGKVLHRPALIWWTVSGVGLATTGLLVVYDQTIRKRMVNG